MNSRIPSFLEANRCLANYPDLLDRYRQYRYAPPPKHYGQPWEVRLNGQLYFAVSNGLIHSLQPAPIERIETEEFVLGGQSVFIRLGNQVLLDRL